MIISYASKNPDQADSLQCRRILCARVQNIPSSVYYNPPSWIRKTLEAWSECKRTEKGVGVRQKGERGGRGPPSSPSFIRPNFPRFANPRWRLNTRTRNHRSTTKKIACTADYQAEGNLNYIVLCTLQINNVETAGAVGNLTCSACKASWNSGNKFSYSDGSARESAAFLLIFPKSSFHNLTILAQENKKVNNERYCS